MKKPVKPESRSYKSPLRTAQAETTRAAILDAARGLFVEKGWSGTTIAAVSAAATVSNETVYAVFGSKRAILQALVANAVRGAAPGTPLLDQREPRESSDETDQHRQIALFAGHITAVLGRVAPIMAVVRTAAETDPEMAALYAELHRGRRKNLETLTGALLRNGPLRSGLDGDAATATVWRLVSPELFLLMRDIEGMTGDRYAAWLERSRTALLLE